MSNKKPTILSEEKLISPQITTVENSEPNALYRPIRPEIIIEIAPITEISPEIMSSVDSKTAAYPHTIVEIAPDLPGMIIEAAPSIDYISRPTIPPWVIIEVAPESSPYKNYISKPVVEIAPEIEPIVEVRPIIEISPIIEVAPEVSSAVNYISKPIVEIAPEINPIVEISPIVDPEMIIEIAPETSPYKNSINTKINPDLPPWIIVEVAPEIR